MDETVRYYRYELMLAGNRAPYFTPGKVYAGTKVSRDGLAVEVTDDRGDRRVMVPDAPCAHGHPGLPHLPAAMFITLDEEMR